MDLKIKKSLKKLFLVLLLISFQNITFSEESLYHEDKIVACSNFYDAVKKSENPRVKNLYPRFIYDDFGFYIKSTTNTEGKWIASKNQSGYVQVGEIYSYETLNKISSEDSIIFINGERISSLDDFNSINFSDNIEKITIDLLNSDGKPYRATIKRHFNGYAQIEYSLEDIYVSNIDIKTGTATFAIREAFQYNYDVENNESKDLHPIYLIAEKYLVEPVEEGENPFVHICYPTAEQFKHSGLMNPLDADTRKLVKSDKDLIQINHKITTYVTPYQSFENVRVETERTSLQTVRNQFNLRSFPFDKQTIKYQFADNSFEIKNRILFSQSFTDLTLNNFMSIDDISGWEKKNYEVKRIKHRDTVNVEGQYRDGLSIEIELERKHGYYIFKVILPIILILSVCWSVVWVDPRELEARLTITIVCLLSLIAYNFVIDAELPKLEYLTVLDWIVLISYFYATVPNFLSIISFRLQKTNLKLSNQLEVVSKRYGLSSYVLSIFVIVWINAFSNPDNSSSLISWMVPY